MDGFEPIFPIPCLGSADRMPLTGCVLVYQLAKLANT